MRSRLCIAALLLLTPLTAEARLDVFGSFEDEAELRAISASRGVRFTPSTRFPAWRGKSLEVTFPGRGGTLEMGQVPGDWGRQQSLLLFAWAEREGSLRLTLSDASDGSFSRTFALKKGVNHLQLRLSEATSVNLRQMKSLALGADRKATLYLDYFALDRFHPVLEQRGRWDINYSMDVATPHIPWARPFAGRALRVYAIADVADGRGIVELAQRLEMDFRAATIGRSAGTNKWGFGDFYEQRAAGGEFWSDAFSLAHTYIADDLLHGPEYDVILWPGLHPWESYPPVVHDAIRKRVEKGTGLVFFYPAAREATPALWNPTPLRLKEVERQGRAAPNRVLDHSQWQPQSDHYITRGVPFDAFPWRFIGVPATEATGQVLLKSLNGTPVLGIGTAGKGRVVTFGYTEKGMIPAIDSLFETGLHYGYHEYLWSLVARAIIWAAQKEPAAAIETVEPSDGGVLVRLANTPLNARVTASIRNAFGETELELSASPAPKADRVILPFTEPLKGGRHFADVRLFEGESVHDWASLTFDQSSAVTIQSVIPASDRVKLGEEVPVRVRLLSPSGAEGELRISLLDNYGRLLDRRSIPAKVVGEVEQTVRLNSTGALTHLARVDAEVWTNQLRQDRRIAEVFVLQPRQWDDYDIVMYRFGPDPIPGIWPTIDRQMRRLEVTTLSSYSLSHSKHANYNIQAQTRVSGQESPDGALRDYYLQMKKKYLETGDKRVLVREYCLDDPSYRERLRQELEQLTGPWVPFSPLSYYIYEEPSLTCYGDAVDICFSPHSLKAMRQWLRGEYGSLEALNRQWETQFADWEDVIPDDSKEAQARGNYASWADHRTFMEVTYADTYKFVHDELRKIDQGGIVLNSGTQISGSHNGCDYSRLNQYTRHLNAYSGGNQLDFHRCFNPDVKISGGAGYGVLGKDVFYDFYSNLFKGANGGAYIFWQYSTLDPDLTMSQSGKDMEKGFQELRGEGIGKLVGLATPDNHGIAIHYSYPSLHGAWIVDGKILERVSYHTSQTFDRFSDNRDGWVKILKDSGLQFDFISYRDVEHGRLIDKGYKTFVLPMSLALSDQEVAAIQEFVRQGGTVIADALPGVMDQHCTFRQRPALQDVFGVDRSRADRDLIVSMTGEPQLKPKTARPLVEQTERPRLLANSFGKGKAYLLNYLLHSYPQERQEGKNHSTLLELGRVLDHAQIRPKVSLSTPGGKPVTDVEMYLFNNDSTRLLGLIPGPDGPEKQMVRVRFESAASVYDVRRKRFVTAGNQFEVELEPQIPGLFALVPNAVTGLDLRAPGSVRAGEEIACLFQVQGPAALRSVAKVRVLDPQGGAVRYYGGNTDIRDGKGSFAFRTALNDPKGQWKVEVTEVISGMSRQALVSVQ
ncbi:MAG: beta-galactosidase [Acidobacteriota bacterium]